MNKKLWTIVVSVLLIVTMSVCLFACTDANKAEDNGSSLKLRGGASNASVTKSIQVGTRASFEVASTVDTSVSEIASNISFTAANGNTVVLRILANNTKSFTVMAEDGFAAGWYDFELKSTTLSFPQYPGATKLVISVDEDDLSAELSSNVIYLAAGSAAIFGEQTVGSVSTFMYDSRISGEIIKMGDTILVQDEEGNYAAYNIWGVQSTTTEGVYQIAYSIPTYDQVYDKFEASSKAKTTAETVDFSNSDEAVDALVEQVSAAGFNVGPVRVDANVKGNEVNLTVTISVLDVFGDKDGSNSVNLRFVFDIKTEITANTNISIGKLLDIAKNDITVDAVFDTKMSFTVEAEDGLDVGAISGLDEIILKIKNLINKTDDNALSVPIFNWIIPIGNGVADVNFQVNAVLNFTFSGKIGATAYTSASFGATLKYNPATKTFEEKDIHTIKSLSFDGVQITIDGDVTLYVGIEATIKFQLLAGVLEVGIGAEVGNYNRIYTSLETIPLVTISKDDFDYNGGYYVEGGIYYDVKFLYGISGITSGGISLIKGRQEKELYTFGSKYVVTYLDEADMTVSTVAADVRIKGYYRDIVAGTPATETLDYIKDVRKIYEVSEQTNRNYVEIVDGQIKLTKNWIKDGCPTLTDYVVTVQADQVQAVIRVDSVKTIDTVDGALVSVAQYGDVTVKLVISDTEEEELTVTDGKFTAVSGTILVYDADGNIVKIYTVA